MSSLTTLAQRPLNNFVAKYTFNQKTKTVKIILEKNTSHNIKGQVFISLSNFEVNFLNAKFLFKAVSNTRLETQFNIDSGLSFTLIEEALEDNGSQYEALIDNLFIDFTAGTQKAFLIDNINSDTTGTYEDENARIKTTIFASDNSIKNEGFNTIAEILDFNNRVLTFPYDTRIELVDFNLDTNIFVEFK